jgi:hypothetical protein
VSTGFFFLNWQSSQTLQGVEGRCRNVVLPWPTMGSSGESPAPHVASRSTERGKGGVRESSNRARGGRAA